MAHEIDFSNNRANVAFVGDVPWHGLGTQLDEDADLEQWRIAAGLDWSVERARVEYSTESGETLNFSGKSVLYRSDTRNPLGVVSDDYKPVQPIEVIDFFSDLVDQYGFRMNTAGSLKGGRVIWALAETGKHFNLTPKDKVNGFLLLSTSADKSMATRAQLTSVRVVCNNTLQAAVGQNGTNYISTPHSADFDATEIKHQMGIYEDLWGGFEDVARQLVDLKVSANDAQVLIANTFQRNDNQELDDLLKMPTVKKVYELYDGGGMGSNLKSAKGTAWGVVNAITQHIDHSAGRSTDSRVYSAWFRKGQQLKSRAVEEALKLAA